MYDLEHLKEVYQNNISSELLIREKMQTEDDGKYFYVPGFEGRSIIKMLIDFFVNKDLAKAKNSCFNVARVAEYMSVVYDWRIIESGINRLSYALLSDNKELIQRYSVLRNIKNHELSLGFQISNAIQNILLDNNQGLEENINKIDRFVKLPRFKWWMPINVVFKGFLSNTYNEIEVGLHDLIKTNKKRNTDLLISNFISIDTCGLCKLAWIKGYEIDLKSEMVPQELMPIKPLDHYEEYEFLK